MTPITHLAVAAAPETGRQCGRCGSRLYVLVHVDRNDAGASVTYYACDDCAQVVIREP